MHNCNRLCCAAPNTEAHQQGFVHNFTQSIQKLLQQTAPHLLAENFDTIVEWLLDDYITGP